MNTDKTKLLICVHLCSSVAIFSSFGCGRYASFTLPEMSGGDTSLVYRFVAQPEPVLTRDEFRDALNPSVAGRMNLYSVSVAIFSSFGCGRYASFTLPEMSGGDTSLVYRFVAQPEPVLTRDEFHHSS